MVYPLGSKLVRVLAPPVPLPAPQWAGNMHSAHQVTHSVLVQGIGHMAWGSVSAPRRATKPRTVLVRPHAPGQRLGWAPCVLVGYAAA
jgi:hypothetical protein